MMKVVCTPQQRRYKKDVDLQVVLFNRRADDRLGETGYSLLLNLVRNGIEIPKVVWDVLSIALAVIAADTGCIREKSADGWTRDIELRVAVQDVKFWNTQTAKIEQMLKFLTGDIWHIKFLTGGISAPKVKRKRNGDEDSVCLLSGGMDSLVGAINLVSEGFNPYFASQVASGDKETQNYFAEMISNNSHHLQLNHNIHIPGNTERSQRARSLIFLTYGVIAATSLNLYASGERITLFVPENGFISLNVPLTPLRLGSLSTRTTHPVFIEYFQGILDAAQLRVDIKNPFQMKTKGEILKECLNQSLLKKLVFESTSCGRFARMGFMHCGRCVPCIIRRAAFYHRGIKDKTRYRYGDLSIQDLQHRNFDDVFSARFAIEQIKMLGLDRWLGGALSYPSLGDVVPYQQVIKRGVKEMARFLKSVGAL